MYINTYVYVFFIYKSLVILINFVTQRCVGRNHRSVVLSVRRRSIRILGARVRRQPHHSRQNTRSYWRRGRHRVVLDYPRLDLHDAISKLCAIEMFPCLSCVLLFEAVHGRETRGVRCNAQCPVLHSGYRAGSAVLLGNRNRVVIAEEQRGSLRAWLVLLPVLCGGGCEPRNLERSVACQ